MVECQGGEDMKTNKRQANSLDGNVVFFSEQERDKTIPLPADDRDEHPTASPVSLSADPQPNNENNQDHSHERAAPDDMNNELTRSRRVGAWSVRPGPQGVARRQCDIPMLARKDGGVRINIFGSASEPQNENEDEEVQESDAISEEPLEAAQTTAFCLETGEHVEISQTAFATAELVAVNGDGETTDTSNTYNNCKEIIPPLPDFAICRDGPTQDVVQCLLRFSETDGSWDANIASSTAVTVISGMGGLGKSIIASAAASNPAVLAAFNNKISWLSLGPTKLSPVSYRNTLLKLCSQVLKHSECYDGVKTELAGFPFELEQSESEQVMKKEFTNLKAIVAPLLSGRKILIVLDNVWHDDDISCFAFGKEIHILVTTRKLDVSEAGRISPSTPLMAYVTIDLGLPSEDESVILLEKVSGLSFSGVNSACSMADVREILRRCNFLPLAIVAIGLLMKGCDNFRPVEARQILETLNPSGGGDIDQVNIYSSCYHVFDQSFRYFEDDRVVGASLRLCFAAFCSCFTNISGGRAPIPFTVVEKFFDDILAGRGGYFTIDEQSIMKHLGIDALKIIQQLRSIGFLDQLNYLPEGNCGDRQTHIVVHHDLQREYGVKAAVIFEELQKNAIFGKWHWAMSKEHTTFELAQARANAVVVRNFERRAVQKNRMCFSNGWNWSKIEGDDKAYMLEFLSTHMIRAHEHQKALDLCVDLSMVSCRIEYFGVKKWNMLGLQDLQFAGQAILEKKCSSLFWIKGECVYEEAVVSKFIKDAQIGKDAINQLNREVMELRLQWILNGPWVISFTMATSSSPLYIIFRRVRSRHYKRICALLDNTTGIEDHPFVVGFYSTYLHWKGDLERSLEVRHRNLILTKEMYPDEPMLEASEHLDLLLTYLAKGSYKESVSHGKSFLSGVKSALGTKDSVEFATALAIFGLSQWFDGQLQESQSSFQQAYDMYLRTGYSGEGLNYVQEKLKNSLK